MERLSRAVGVPTRAELGREPETDVKKYVTEWVWERSREYTQCQLLAVTHRH